MSAHTQAYRLEWDAVQAEGSVFLSEDSELQTAVVISLFTDARAREDTPYVKADEDWRGWWADTALSNRRPIGSLLWTLARAPLTAQTMALAESYAEDALQWMIEDGVATAVSATTSRLRRDALALRTTVTRPQNIAPRWSHVWEVPVGIR